jgi:hypothetical protein
LLTSVLVSRPLGYGRFTNNSRQKKETLNVPKALFAWRDRKESDMLRLVALTALALSMGIAPVLAADTPAKPPTANTTSPEASKSATNPPSGSADTSGGAKEQSSSPPSAGSTMGKMGAQSSPSGGQTTPNPTAPAAND